LNLFEEFNKGFTFEEYLSRMNEQKAIFDLHYRKANVVPFKVEGVPALKLLIISELHCSDSTALLAALKKYFEDERVDFRFALRSENPELMQRFLTNGAQAIPIVIILDNEGNYLERFGPRPKAAQDIFEKYRQDINEGRIERKEVSKKIRNFYARDKGNAILQEFSEKLNELSVTM